MVYTPGDTSLSAGPKVLMLGVSDAGSQFVAPIQVTATGRIWVRVQELANLTYVAPGANIVGFMAEVGAALYGTYPVGNVVKPIATRQLTAGVAAGTTDNLIESVSILAMHDPVSGAADFLDFQDDAGPTVTPVGSSLPVISKLFGWDGAAYHQLLCDITGQLKTTGTGIGMSTYPPTEGVPVKYANVALANTGNVITPTAGKKFRLLKYLIEITGQATLAAGATLVLTLVDNVTNLKFVHRLYVPAVAMTTFFAYSTGWNDLGSGYLSLVANNILSMNFSVALTAGTANIICLYTEE